MYVHAAFAGMKATATAATGAVTMTPALPPLSTSALFDYITSGIEEFFARQPVVIPKSAAPDMAQLLVLRRYVALSFPDCAPSPRISAKGDSPCRKRV